jgi:hypothetical protein
MTAGDFYSAELLNAADETALIAALRDEFDRVDPVPPQVVAAGMRIDVTRQTQAPQQADTTTEDQP